jgi:hypothetical protein
MTQAYSTAVLDHSLETVCDLISDFNEHTMHLLEIVEANRTLIEWAVALETEPQHPDRWRAQFQSWIL